jgi:hypothetical protein
VTDEPALQERAEDHLAALQKELAGRVGALRLETPDGERPLVLLPSPPLRSWTVRTPDGVGLRVDAGGRMWTVVTITHGGYRALIEPGTPLERVGPVTDPGAAARRVSRMLGVS